MTVCGNSNRKPQKGWIVTMIEQDTVKLLRECNAGIKMGVQAIDELLPKAEEEGLREVLSKSKKEHEKLGDQTHQRLNDYHDEGKEPHPVAKGMSWMKTNMKMAMEQSDHVIADLITDGCNMGVKSLSRYLNQYAAADEESKDIAKKLIRMEEDLAVKMRDYL